MHPFLDALGSQYCAIIIDGEDSNRAVQEKLFSLGCGYLDKHYPLTQDVRINNRQTAIRVYASGMMDNDITLADYEQRDDIPSISYSLFLYLDFSSEQQRINHAIAKAERCFDIKHKLDTIGKQLHSEFTEAEMKVIDRCHQVVLKAQARNTDLALLENRICNPSKAQQARAVILKAKQQRKEKRLLNKKRTYPLY